MGHVEMEQQQPEMVVQREVSHASQPRMGMDPHWERSAQGVGADEETFEGSVVLGGCHRFAEEEGERICVLF